MSRKVEQSPQHVGERTRSERCQHGGEDRMTIQPRAPLFLMPRRRSCSKRATRLSVLDGSPASGASQCHPLLLRDDGRLVHRVVPARSHSELGPTRGSACFASAALGLLGPLVGSLERGPQHGVHRAGQSPQGNPIRDRRVVSPVPAWATGALAERDRDIQSSYMLPSLRKAIVLLLSAVSRFLTTENAFDLDIGHTEVIEFVEHCIREIEGERLECRRDLTRSLPVHRQSPWHRSGWSRRPMRLYFVT